MIQKHQTLKRKLLIIIMINKRIRLSLHYNAENSYLFVYSREITKFKARDSEIVETPLCLRNISKYIFVSNI